MSIELAEKIKAMAQQGIATAALVDKLEARIRVLEDQSLRNQLQVVGPDKPFKVVLPADKRPRGRPKKVA